MDDTTYVCHYCGNRVSEANGDWYEQRCATCNDLYVHCSQAECRALKAPATLVQYVEAWQHWKSHTYLSGCSHGN